MYAIHQVCVARDVIKIRQQSQRQCHQRFIKQQQQMAACNVALEQVQDELAKTNEMARQAQKDYYNKKQLFACELTRYQDSIARAKDSYLQTIEQAMSDIEIEFKNRQTVLKNQYKGIEKELQSIKSSLVAAIEASIRAQQTKQKMDFYKVQIGENELKEISTLQEIEYKLKDARPLNMLIWTTYYSKKANDLCSRVLGTKTICGIYKLTDTTNGKCYIGQAKDMKQRWRQHMKCGLGIDTPPYRKLYKAMHQHGIQNFTFELLQSCSTAELNAKEKMFIDLYSSYDYGYNENRGIG